MLSQLIASLGAKPSVPESGVRSARAPIAASGLIPNFCQGEMIWHVVVLAELLAVVATIVTPPLTQSLFGDIFLISLFLQWIALTSVSALCVMRPYLNKLPERRAVMMAYLTLLLVTWLVGELSLWLLSMTNRIESPHPAWYGYFQAQNLTVSAIVNALVLRYFIARHQLRLKTLSEERARAEIMRYRIRPHFLFNSMNIIASLTQRAPVRAEAAIEDMADLFRLMLDDSKDLMPAQHEISVARKYIKLEKLRLEHRLNAEWEISSIPRTARMPVLMLQLLLENAVHHGIEQLADGGTIHISLQCSDGVLTTTVTNPGPEEEDDGIPAEKSTAIDNIRLRLREHYGDAASLSIEKQEQNLIVKVTHPAFGDSYEDTGS